MDCISLFDVAKVCIYLCGIGTQILQERIDSKYDALSYAWGDGAEDLSHTLGAGTDVLSTSFRLLDLRRSCGLDGVVAGSIRKVELDVEKSTRQHLWESLRPFQTHCECYQRSFATLPSLGKYLQGLHEVNLRRTNRRNIVDWRLQIRSSENSMTRKYSGAPFVIRVELPRNASTISLWVDAVCIDQCSSARRAIALKSMVRSAFCAEKQTLDKLCGGEKDPKYGQTMLYGLGGIGKTQIALNHFNRQQLRRHSLLQMPSNGPKLYRMQRFVEDMERYSHSPLAAFMLVRIGRWMLVDPDPSSALSRIRDIVACVGCGGLTLDRTRHLDEKPLGDDWDYLHDAPWFSRRCIIQHIQQKAELSVLLQGDIFRNSSGVSVQLGEFLTEARLDHLPMKLDVTKHHSAQKFADLQCWELQIERHYQPSFSFPVKTPDRPTCRMQAKQTGDDRNGPAFSGPPELSREDDDDDDCVGFHRFAYISVHALHASTLWVLGRCEVNSDDEKREKWHTGSESSECGTLPKYGAPKRDPVAAASDHISVDEATISLWRGVIARTCGGIGGGAWGEMLGSRPKASKVKGDEGVWIWEEGKDNVIHDGIRHGEDPVFLVAAG